MMMKFTLTNESVDDIDSINKNQNDPNDTSNDDTHEHFQSNQQQIITVVPIEKDAPNSEHWYHGRLDRLVSEARLRHANKPAGFLVRESERKPGSFVLSYYSLKSNIYHFKITAVFGDYYIGGRRFDRLETLISYYMYYSELVKGEKLETPVPPQRICRLERTYLSIKPYHYHLHHTSRTHLPIRVNDSSTKMSNINNYHQFNWNSAEDILYFEKIGERFKVFHEVGDGEWLWAQSCKTNEFGLLNANCVIQIDDFKLHEIEPWYYTNISKEEAASILADAGNFSYLVRPSDQAQGNFTLFFYVDNIVHRYRITSCQDDTLNDEENEEGEEEVNMSKEFYTKYYSIGGRDFTSINSIVERYMNEDIVEGYRLTKVPHKRAEYYSQSITAFLKAYLSYKNIDYIVEHSERLEKSCSFKIKSTTSSSKTHEPYSLNVKRNSIIQNSNSNNVLNTATVNYLNIPDFKTNTKLSQSLNETTLNSTLTSTNNTFSSKKLQTTTSYKQINDNNNNSMTITNTTPKNTLLPTSKSISSPLSSIILHNTNSTLVNSASFRDLRNYDLINQFDVSANISKKMFCGNLSRTSISIKPLNGVDLTSNRKQDKNLLMGYLNKYNEKTKKWKPYWFLLRQTDQQLFYFSNEKRLKEKGLIDLSYGYYYPVDDSFFNKPYCFQIIIQTLGGSNSSSNTNNQTSHSSVNNNIVHYLAADNLQMFKEWIENIRPLCNPIQFNPFVCKFGTSSMSCLSLSSSLSSTSSTASSSSSTSSSLSSSSPLNTSESDPQHHNQINLKRIKSFNQHHNHHHQTHQQHLHHHLPLDKNYRILRTLNVDIHEARNVCFSPQTKSNQTINENYSTLNSNHTTHAHNLPKFHKDNLYYCLILLNNHAYVASTRHTTCNAFQSNTNNNLLSSSFTTNSSSNSFDGIGNSNSNTNKNSSKDSIWDDSFTFDNLPLDVKELKICLFVIAKPTNFSASFVNNLKKISSSNANSKMLDPLLIGSVNIRLDDLINKGLHEAWYNLEPEVHINNYYDNKFNSSLKQSNNCTLRAKIRFCEEKIYLNKDHYKDLCDYLMDEKEHKNLCTIYEQIIPSTERSYLVHSLVRFFIVKNQIVEMLKSFLITEIDRCADLSTLFRPATMSTSLMDHYMRTRCEFFLRKALEEPLIRILKQNQTNSANCNSQTSSSSTSSSPINQSNLSNIKSFELDPTKCKDASQREKNLINLQTALKELINSICNNASIGLFPNELKHLFYLVRQRVHFKWKQQQCINNSDTFLNNTTTTTDDKLVRIYCVSAFVFLRLLCPALLNPKNFGLKFFDSLTNTISTGNSNLDTPSEKSTSNNNVLNYIDLANQFGVFSPAFMFSLSPPNNLKLSHLQTTSEMNTSTTTPNTPVTQLKHATASSSSIQIASVYERHIKLLAKVLQTLANMTECKEPFMVPLSDFLNVNKPNVIKFIEDISSLNELNSTHVIKLNQNEDSNNSVYETTSSSELNDQFENASCKYLAILYRLLDSYVPQMKQHLDKSKSLLNDSIHNIEDCPEDDQDRKIKGDDSSFQISLQKLINILNDISKKTK